MARESLILERAIDVYMLIGIAFKVDSANASVYLEHFLTKVSYHFYACC